MKRNIVNSILLFCVFPLLNSQYISEVLEYVPAPSQYMNAEPWGTPSSAESIIGGMSGHVSLGSFGGYIVFRFDGPVENDPDNPFGVDFTIFGNPLENWSEPGIVSVMKDENRNGMPDDTWYELAGSDHFFSTTTQNYTVSYENPEKDDAADVPWTDNQGNSGFIEANSFFAQSYYPNNNLFPGINEKAYTLSGTALESTIDTAFETGIYSLQRGFGYSDNLFRGKAPYTLPDNPYTRAVENSGGDAFDISWAIDNNGNYLDLDEIDFIKVQTGVMDGAGWLGQISTEIIGAVDVSPDNSIQGPDEMVVIKELPIVLSAESIQLEVYTFSKGRIQTNPSIEWESSLPEVTVDQNNILHVSGSGELKLTAKLSSNRDIADSVKTTVALALFDDIIEKDIEILISPNPARDYIRFNNSSEAEIKIMDLTGKLVYSQKYKSEEIDIKHLSPGIYIVLIKYKYKTGIGKFVKE